jgi:hypothetical protein
MLKPRYAWIIDDRDLVKIAHEIFEKWVLPYFERKGEELLDMFGSSDFLKDEVRIDVKNILVQKFRTEYYDRYVKCQDVQFVLLMVDRKPFMLEYVYGVRFSDIFEELGIIEEYTDEILRILRRKRRV